MRSLATAGFWVGLAMLAFAGPASAYDRQVLIINNSSYAIIEFYASNVYADDWGYELLGDTIIFPHEEHVVDVDDGSGECAYDFQALFDDFTISEEFGIDVCAYNAFTYTD